MADDYDVIIVGSGAGGGTLAHRLAPSGKRVLIAERGDWPPREIENWDATAVRLDSVRRGWDGRIVVCGRASPTLTGAALPAPNRPRAASK